MNETVSSETIPPLARVRDAAQRCSRRVAEAALMSKQVHCHRADTFADGVIHG